MTYRDLLNLLLAAEESTLDETVTIHDTSRDEYVAVHTAYYVGGEQSVLDDEHLVLELVS